MSNTDVQNWNETYIFDSYENYTAFNNTNKAKTLKLIVYGTSGFVILILVMLGLFCISSGIHKYKKRRIKSIKRPLSVIYKPKVKNMY